MKAGMQTLFSSKRDYRTWIRKRLPIVKELVRLGFTREEMAECLKASVSTIQRDLNELRERRTIGSEPPRLNFKAKRQLILRRLSSLEKMMADNEQSKEQERLFFALRAWAEQNNALEAKHRQTKLPWA
jgi:predicted DNA-binding transcriptional regulator YafY